MTEKQLQKNIGKVLTELRLKKNLDQKNELTNETSIHRNTYYNMEQGLTNPVISNLKKLVDYHGLTLSEFFQMVESVDENAENQ